MLSRCFLDCSVGVGFFVTGLSHISSFFSCPLVFKVSVGIGVFGHRTESDLLLS